MIGPMHAMRAAPGGIARMPSLSEFGARFGNRVVRSLDVVLTWRARARERAALATMDDRMLRDIGIDRAETFAEIDKPFWRA